MASNVACRKTHGRINGRSHWKNWSRGESGARFVPRGSMSCVFSLGMRFKPVNDTKVVKPTHMNLSVLVEYLKKGDSTIGRVEDADAPHLRRCIHGGVLVSGATRGTWILSASGAAMLAEYEARRVRVRSAR